MVLQVKRLIHEKEKKNLSLPSFMFPCKWCKKNSIFVCVCFPSLAQTSQERKWFIKHLKTPLLLVSSHRGRTCTYTQCVGFSLEPANEALQPVQNGARTRSHTLFGEYMDIKENTTHEAYHRKTLDCNCTYILLNAASKCTSYIHTGCAACILG